jgi:5-(carboxyamino)imidazole ribonucleotide synthase
LGLPLGATTARGHAAMINLIGRMPSRNALIGEDELHWHDYGKTEREGRKLGHITLLERTASRRDVRANRLLRRIDSAIAR